MRTGDRALPTIGDALDGLSGGSLIPLPRGETMMEECWGCSIGDICERPAWWLGVCRCEPGLAESDGCPGAKGPMECEDDGRSPPSSIALNEPRLDGALEPGAVEGPCRGEGG